MNGPDIRTARRELGLSINGMADALGMNRRSIQRMETGVYEVSARTQTQVQHLLLRKRLIDSLGDEAASVALEGVKKGE